MPLQDINQGTPRDTLYPWGKGVCEQKTTDCCLRQSVGQKRSYRGPRGILCTRGEKEHTSKRVSVIACDNVISKAKCATCGRGFAHSCKSSLRSPNAKTSFWVQCGSSKPLKKDNRFGCLFLMVPVAGLEPARYRYRWILSPLRLPIPSHRHKLLNHSSTTILFLQLI